MRTLKNRILSTALAVGTIVAAGTVAHADPLAAPAMSGPLAANPNPFSVDLPDWLGDAGGKLYITGALTGLAYVETGSTHKFFAPFNAGFDLPSNVDISNAEVTIQKTDGWLQFYAQIGEYSLPTLGSPYVKSSNATPANFGVVPVAYLKIAPNADWSIEAGKLPTLYGDEYTFTFENMNIERGLLWNTEPAVSRGVQVNYAHGPLTVSVSWNDGLYSNDLNWISGLISYGFNGGADTLSFVGGGSVGSGFHTSLLNSGSIYDLIYTHTSGPWTISPYLQYTTTPKFGLKKTPEDLAGALLVSYSFNDNWKLAARAEYESESGSGDLIGFGTGSKAWSITVTPTYQWKVFFARVDGSYVGLGHASIGFGSKLTTSSQFRGMLEAGILL